MTIPSDETIEKHRQEVREGLLKRGIAYPEDWAIEIEVRPYLGYDIRYGCGTIEDPNAKSLRFSVYSARYPSTWYTWIERALDEIAEHLAKKALAGDIPDIITESAKAEISRVLERAESESEK